MSARPPFRGGALRLYVAGGSSERADCQAAIDRLAAAGVVITLDWTRSPGWERPLSVAEEAEQARHDLDAVDAADLVWLRLPERASEGAHVELGYALAKGKRVIVSGEVRAGRIFPRLAAMLFGSHWDAEGWIVGGEQGLRAAASELAARAGEAAARRAWKAGR